MSQQEFSAELNKWRLCRGVEENPPWNIRLVLDLNIVKYSSLICSAQAEVQNFIW